MMRTQRHSMATGDRVSLFGRVPSSHPARAAVVSLLVAAMLAVCFVGCANTADLSRQNRQEAEDLRDKSQDRYDALSWISMQLGAVVELLPPEAAAAVKPIADVASQVAVAERGYIRDVNNHVSTASQLDGRVQQSADIIGFATSFIGGGPIFTPTGGGGRPPVDASDGPDAGEVAKVALSILGLGGLAGLLRKRRRDGDSDGGQTSQPRSGPPGGGSSNGQYAQTPNPPQEAATGRKVAA